jgi:hypothetical protein
VKAQASRLARILFVSVPMTFAVLACASSDDTSDTAGAEEDEAAVDQDTSDLKTAGPCAGQAIERAINCAVGKGARILSFYRSPAEQERVRRENHCTNRCTGSAGCIRPTAGCTTSPHTACHAVDLVADGAPVSRAALRACGLAKTTAPHANHYDLVR